MQRIPHLEKIKALTVTLAVAAATWYVVKTGVTAAFNQNLNPIAAVAFSGGDQLTHLLMARYLEPPHELGTPATVTSAEAAAQTRTTAVRALRAEPLNIEALRQLSRYYQQIGDQPRAAALLLEIHKRNFRDSDVSMQLLRMSVARADIPNMFVYANALLRSRPDLLAPLTPMLVTLADTPAAHNNLIRTMLQNPPWSSAFMAKYSELFKNEQSVMQMFSTLKSLDQPINPTITNLFIGELLQRGRIQAALALWRESIPANLAAARPLLFNGHFRLPVNDFEFNWRIFPAAGVRISVSPIPEKPEARTLLLEFTNQRIQLSGAIRQLTVLPAGRYVFSGLFKPNSFKNARGMIWRFYCGHPKVRKIGESALLPPGPENWTKFDADFEIPAEDCPITLVRLEIGSRVATEDIAAGSVSFTDLEIRNAL